MNKTDVCNNTEPGEEEFIHLGPASLYLMFGPTIPILYTVSLILTIFLWVYGFYFRPTKSNPHQLHILYLQLCPALHVTLTLPALLSPPTAPLVSLLQDCVSVSAMLVFTNLTISLLGGEDTIASHANTTHPTSCPIGTPPLCCLMPCRKPKITTRIIQMILLPVRLLSAAIFINFLINLFIVFSGFYPSRDFVNFSNLHNILIIPFFISTMYTYKVFIAVTSSMLVGSSHKLRGILNFIMFVFCKSTFGFVNILIGKNLYKNVVSVKYICGLKTKNMHF